MTRACRFHLRRNRVSLAALTAISEGEGIADLIQDLNELAELVGTHLSAFDEDQTFDAPVLRQTALQVAAEIEAGLVVERVRGEQRKLKEQRDRAFTYLSEFVDELRDFGRYCFPDTPNKRAAFSSSYSKRANRRRTPTIPPAALAPN